MIAPSLSRVYFNLGVRATVPGTGGSERLNGSACASPSWLAGWVKTAPAEFDSGVRFRALAAQGHTQSGLELLDKLDAYFGSTD